MADDAYNLSEFLRRTGPWKYEVLLWVRKQLSVRGFLIGCFCRESSPGLLSDLEVESHVRPFRAGRKRRKALP